jgi:AcrR family transcriptional regulator
MQMIRRQRNAHRSPEPFGSDGSVPSSPARRSTGRRTPEEARQEIIDLARAHLSQYGFRDFTVDRLMRDTKVGRSAFYAYFSSVYELAAVFLHELSDQLDAAGVGWFDPDSDPIEAIRSALRRGVAFWQSNGRMIRALEEAAWQHDALRAAWRDEVGTRVTRSCTEAILRDQAKGLIGPMDAREMAVALNRFNVTYLNDRFGNPRRKSKNTDAATALETLERVWIGTLYGRVSHLEVKLRRRGGSPDPHGTRPDRGSPTHTDAVRDHDHEGADLKVGRNRASSKRLSSKARGNA